MVEARYKKTRSKEEKNTRNGLQFRQPQLEMKSSDYSDSVGTLLLGDWDNWLDPTVVS